jgi:hypothetical protein
MLENGSSGSCRYALTSDAGGKLVLPMIFFTPHGQSVDSATLELADGTRRSVRVTFGPRVSEATFGFTDRV